MKFLLAIAPPLYAVDQLTKWLVLRSLELDQSRPVIPGVFNLVHVTNTGAAFGSFKDSNSFFIILSALVTAGLLVFWWRGAFQDVWSRTGVALLLAGILGNLTDRILHGHVIDFLDFYFREHHWPSFNVADSCICVAAGMFFLTAFREKREAR